MTTCLTGLEQTLKDICLNTLSNITKEVTVTEHEADMALIIQWTKF